MNIIIKDLHKTYPGGHHALKGLNLEVGTGMFGLLGPNGAGKTSLMRILTLLQGFTSGQVTINGLDLSKDRKALRSILGYLPQDFRFFEKLKTWEFLDYGAALAGMKNKSKRRAHVDELLHKVGLLDVRERYANKLSGGMKRRLGIAQAIIGEPKVIIVDEPTTGLDPEERIRFRNILSDISKQEVTIILSTHIVGDISSTCEDLALLNRGELVFRGSPEALAQTAQGHVFSMEVDDQGFDALQEKYPVISTISEDGRWVVEFVAEELGKEEQGAQEIEANLEHAYVYFMDFYLKDTMDMRAKKIL